MKWAPTRFNDTLAGIVLAWILALFTYIVWAGIQVDTVGMIVGALIGWGGTVLTFYFRKKPSDGGDPPIVPHG